MMTPPVDPTEVEVAWRLELEAILADLEAGAYAEVNPQRLPVHLGAVPESLAPLANRALAAMISAADEVRTQLDAVGDELQSNSTRGSRRWAHQSPAPSQLDCSA